MHVITLKNVNIMKANRSKFSQIKQQYDLQKMASAYILAEQHIIKNSSNGMADGMDAVQFFKTDQDPFGNVTYQEITVKDAQIHKLEGQLLELEELGRTLLNEEKYELFQEARDLYNATKSQLNKLRST